ncbi:MAG: 50S ribosomal protein L19 [Verrucomicrobia bacterium]|nr:MAG: 50S ribosomal protein L19 [Verrucomicrobiota bacterium]
MHPIIKEITKEQERTDLPAFKVGDGVKVHSKVREGDKERVQIFAGIVIAIRGTGVQTTFTVRRVSSGEGIERIFPKHSPNIVKIEIDRESDIMRARMYYMRNRIGKSANKVKVKAGAVQK